MNYKYSDFKDGLSFKAEKVGSYRQVEGKISIEKGLIYLCQDKASGSDCEDKKGFKHSWIIGNKNFYEGLESVEGLVLGKKGKTKKEPVLYVVGWDTASIDPYKAFTSKKELKKWLLEAKDNREIVFNSIRIFEVKKELAVKTSFSFKKI